MKAGVNITAMVGDEQTPNVIINGTLSFSSAGTCTISNIRLQTNSANFLSISGSAASIVNLENCYLNASNNTGISFTTSNATAQLNIYNCKGDVGTTGITAFVNTSTGTLSFWHSIWTNSGSTTTTSSCNGTIFNSNWSIFYFPITITAVGSSMNFSQINSGNSTCFTTVTSGTSNLTSCFFGSGTASSISIGTGTIVTMAECDVVSTNTNAITGAGTLQYNPISFQGSSSTVNTSTQTPKNIGPAIYASGGISFNSGTSTLSTYVKNTWSPTISFGGASSGITYTTRVGNYWQIGSVVYFNISITLSSKGSSTGAAAVSLPSTPASDSSDQIGAVLITGGTTAFPTGTTQIVYDISGGTATASLFGVGTTGFSNVVDTNFTNTTLLRLSGFYWVT